MDNLKTARLFVAISAVMALCGARCFAQGIKIHFQAMDREVIENRLKLAPKDDTERERILAKLFQDAGCTGEHLGEQPLKHHRVPNLVCTLPGTGDASIIVGGHMDHVSRGRGVVDDWSGAALLPSLFQSLRDEPRKHTFVFVGFTEEEEGLVGSRFYVKQLEKEQVAKIRAMVNLECLGLSSAEVWGDHADPALLKMYCVVAHGVHLPCSSMNVPAGANDDADSFRGSKVSTITIHSVTQATWSVLHSPGDNFSAIRWDDYYDSYRLIVTYLAYLDQALN